MDRLWDTGRGSCPLYAKGYGYVTALSRVTCYRGLPVSQWVTVLGGKGFCPQYASVRAIPHGGFVYGWSDQHLVCCPDLGREDYVERSESGFDGLRWSVRKWACPE